MLSAESASGQYPVKAVEAMVRICLGAERQFDHETDFEKAPRNLQRVDQAVAMATMFLTEHIGVQAIIALTESGGSRSEEHTSELQSLMRISYAVFCLKKQIRRDVQEALNTKRMT